VASCKGFHSKFCDDPATSLIKYENGSAGFSDQLAAYSLKLEAFVVSSPTRSPGERTVLFLTVCSGGMGQLVASS